MLLKKKEKYTLAEPQVRDLLLLTAREGGGRSRAIFGEHMGGDYEDLTANVRDFRILQIPMGGSHILLWQVQNHPTPVLKANNNDQSLRYFALED